MAEIPLSQRAQAGWRYLSDADKVSILEQRQKDDREQLRRCERQVEQAREALTTQRRPWDTTEDKVDRALAILSESETDQ